MIDKELDEGMKTMSIMNAVDAFKNETEQIAVAGDWHGHSMGASMSLEKVSELSDAQIILHLGDFGLWTGNSGRKYFFYVNKILTKLDHYLFVTLGNHENYDLLAKFEDVPGMPGCKFSPDHDRIIFFARGFDWEWNDKKFMSFGGANSIDRQFRTEGKDWWVGEQITDADVDAGISVGKVDVMFSHDAPYGIDILGSHRSNGWAFDAMLYSDESRKQLKRVSDVAQPSMLFHGHYHIPRNEMDTLRVDGEYEFYQINTICLDKELTVNNVGVLNVQTLDFQILTLKD